MFFGVGVSCRNLYSFVVYLYVNGGGSIDQPANLHFHFTSVPRCTPVEVQRNTDGDTPSSGSITSVGEERASLSAVVYL